MNIKHSIGLNLSADGIPPRLHMVQGDSNSRTIVATLWDGAKPYNVPNESSVMIRFRKPDGTGGLYDSSEAGETISYAGNVVTAPVATQMLAVAGNVFAEIDIFGSGSGTAAERLATFRFIIEVAPCVLPDAEIISSDYYNVLAADIAKVLSASVHAPKIGEDGTWLVWDSEQSKYVETGVSAKGPSGATVSTDGAYGFDVDEDGHLRLHYTGDTAPDFDLDENGHLILTLDSGQTVDLGKVVGSDYVLTDKDKAEIAEKVATQTTQIESVDALPENPDPNVLYLIREEG